MSTSRAENIVDGVIGVVIVATDCKTAGNGMSRGSVGQARP